MRSKYLFFLATLLMLFSACANKTQEEVTFVKPNKVVLMFESMPVNTRYEWEDGHISGKNPKHEICYIDDHSIIRYLTPDYAPANDTLVISSKRNFIEVQHTYKGTDHLSYRFQNGDSVIFTYQGRKPFAKILNRDVSDVEVNYNIIKREKLSHDYFPGLMRINRMFALTKEFDSIPWNRKAQFARQVGIEAALEEFDAEGLWLDSLYQKEIISGQAYDFYHTNRQMDMANAQFHANFGFDLKTVDGVGEVLSPEQLLAMNLDTVSTRFYYHKMLEEKRREFFLSKVDLIRHSNGSYWDSRQAYDLIRRSGVLSKREKDLMLVKTIGEIYGNFDLDDRQEYWKKFKKDVSDKVYLNLVEEKYEFSEPVKDEVELTAFNGEQITMSQALDKHRGKVIYLDFWASWCSPCLKTIPDAKQLQKEYKGKDVVFMYLSIDEEVDKWHAASEEHLLFGATPGYLVTNKKRSRNLDYLNVTSIPRYMIYNRTGELVEGDAPRPGTAQVRDMFDKYLAEDVR